MIIPCNCKHEYQDETYGKGNRVHNFATKAGQGGAGAWRCTVCSSMKPAKTGDK